LMPENQMPAKIFLRVKNQHIMSFGGPVDIRHDVVFQWMDRMGIDGGEDWERCFELINAAYWSMREKMQDKMDKK